jgi:single-strand DNA-binding protein
MSNFRNQVQLIGHLGQDPELKKFETGRALVTFSLATSETWVDKDTGEVHQNTDWHNIKAWGPFGELLFQHLKKGQKAVIAGRLKYDSYEDKNGSKQVRAYILAESFERMTVAGEKNVSGGIPNRMEESAPQDDAEFTAVKATERPQEKEFDDLPF